MQPVAYDNQTTPVVVVLLNWRRAHDTMTCLDSLAALAGPKPAVIVCDNDSRDGSVASLKAYADNSPLNIRILETGGNRGFAGGVNVGLRAALADPDMQYVWILNNDTQVHPAALNALLEKTAVEPEIGICGSTLLYLDAPEKIQAVGGLYNSWLGTTRHYLGHETYSAERCRAFDETTLDYVVGAAMFVPRTVLETVGLMDEHYFLYYEEIDWACQMRYKRPDLHLAYAPDSIVYHAEGASTGSNDRNGKRYAYASDFYMLTSRLKCTRKNFPERLWSVRLSMLLVMLNRMRRGNWAAARLALYLCLGLGVQPLAPTHGKSPL
jgi:hypothetical protein